MAQLNAIAAKWKQEQLFCLLSADAIHPDTSPTNLFWHRQQNTTQLATQCQLESSHNSSEGEAQEARQLELVNLAPITIFVGANNSGKSRLIRELAHLTSLTKFQLSTTTKDLSTENIVGNIMEMICETADQGFQTRNNKWIHKSLSYREVGFDPSKISAYITQMKNDIQTATEKGYNQKLATLRNQLNKMTELGLEAGLREVNNIQRCYVPMMRGMRPPITARDGQTTKSSATFIDEFDPYQQRTIRDYFSQDMPPGWDREKIRIFTGLNIFTDLRKRLLGRTQDIRDTVRENDVVHIKIGEDDEFPIHQLGDGLQSLIICA